MVEAFINAFYQLRLFLGVYTVHWQDYNIYINLCASGQFPVVKASLAILPQYNNNIKSIIIITVSLVCNHCYD